VRVEVFPNSLLYGEKDELEALQLGAVQMLVAPLVNFSALGVRDFDIFELPYLFDGYGAVRRVTDGPVGEALLAQLDAKGMHGLGYWDVGFKELSANRELRLPGDASGLRLRVKYSRVSDAQMRALHAWPQPTSIADMASGIRAGTLDGSENPASILYAERLHELQRYLTLSDHAYIGGAMVANRDFWRRLPPDVRATLEAVARDTTRHANQLAKADNDAALEAMRRSGRIIVVELTRDERSQWKRALMPVHREAAQRMDPALLQAAYAEAGFKPESEVVAEERRKLD
jgi:C4-dicarboxylate-binding protein DctP